MIRIGLDETQKKNLISKWLREHPETDRIFCFYGHEKPDLNFDEIETFYCEWDETEMYRTFYPLLGSPYQGSEHVPAITEKSLLVVDEMLMTKNRSALKYNCTHHFLRVSPHHIVFNWLPIIDDENDFMILLDYQSPDKYKGRSISESLYKAEDCEMISRLFELERQETKITDKQKKKYEEKKESLFENLGSKDPDTIPRTLATIVGDMKKSIIEPGPTFLARNSRFKRANVYTYKSCPPSEDIILLDMQHRFSDFIKMLMEVRPNHITYISTGLPVDEFYFNSLKEWKERIERIYAVAGISK